MPDRHHLPNPDPHPLSDDFYEKLEENIKAILEAELGPHLKAKPTPVRDAIADNFVWVLVTMVVIVWFFVALAEGVMLA